MYELLVFDKETDDLILTQPVFASKYKLVVELGEQVVLGLCLDHGILARFEIKEV